MDQLNQHLGDFFNDSGSGSGKPRADTLSANLSSFFDAKPAPTKGVPSKASPIPTEAVDAIAEREGLTPAQRAVMGALLGQESNNGQNATTSVDGARGAGQIMPDTFRRYAKAGESIDNPDHNLAVMARIVRDLGTKFSDDPARIATGYFSGEGNVNPTGPTAWKADRADGNGKTTSSYAADIMKRIGNAVIPTANAAPAAPDISKAPKWADIAQNPEFHSLPEAERTQAKQAYFDYWIAPNVDLKQRATVRDQFLAKKDDVPGLIARTVGALKGAVSDAFSTQGEGVGAVDPMTGIDPAGQQSATGPAQAPVDPAMRGSVMADLPAGAPSKSATLPITERFRMHFENAYNAASPDQRQAMEKMPGIVGMLAKERNEQAAALPTSASTDMLDPRAEARARRLAVEGMDTSLTESWAKTAAARGTTPGDEVGTISKTDFDFDAQKKFNEDPFYSNPVVRGAVKGVEGFKQGVLGMNQFMAEAVGADDAAAGQAKMAKESRGFTDAMGQPKNGFQRNFEGAVASIAQQIPALIGGVVTGSEPMVLSAMFVQSFGQEYGEGRSRGQSPEQATTRAAQFAALEVIGEKFGLRDSLAGIKAAAKGNVDAAIRSFTQALVKEVPGEQLTAVGQFGVDKEGAGIGLNTEAGVRDLVSQMADTLVQTVMQSGLMIGGGKAVGSAVNKLNTPERQIAREIQNSADTAQIDTQAVDAAARAALDPQSSNAQIVLPEETTKPAVQPAVREQVTTVADVVIPGASQVETLHATPDGRVEPILDAPIGQLGNVAATQAADTSIAQTVDAISPTVETKQEPLEALQASSPTPQSLSPRALLDFANARYEQLLIKRDSSAGLDQSDQQELEALTESHGNPELLSQIYRGGQDPAASTTKDAVDVAAHEAATSPLNDLPEPTAAQKDAGNYKKAHVAIQGLGITFENPQGSKRSGVSQDGKAWESELKHHYGYFKRTEAADGDHVDTFIGPNPDSTKVYIVDQVDPKTGAYDEVKVMVGFNSKVEADAAYHANYEQGWKGRAAITEVPIDQFKDWLKSGKTKTWFSKPKTEKELKARRLAGAVKESKPAQAQQELAVATAAQSVPARKANKPKTEKEAKKKRTEAAVQRANDVLGATIGDTITFTKDVGYITGGKPMVIDRISASGEVWVKDPKTGNGTSEKVNLIQALKSRGLLDWSVTRAEIKPKTEKEAKARKAARIPKAGENLELFSRSGVDSGAVRKNPKLPLSSVETDHTIERVRLAFKRRFSTDAPVRFEKVRQFSDLPAALQNTADAQQAGDSPKGAFFDGTIYVVQDAHTSSEDLEATIFHELYGHAATRRLFGEAWVAKQNALLEAIGGAEGLTKLSSARGIDLRAYMSGLAADANLTDDMRRAVIMDELLAHIAEKGPSFKQKVAEYLGAIRNWLRTHGFATLAKYNDADLSYLLKQARVALGKGGAASAGPILFSRGKNFGALTDAQARALANVGGISVGQSTADRIAEIKAKFRKRAFQQNVVDQFAPLMDLSQEAYMQARLTKASDGTLEAAMLYGKPFLRDGIPDVDINDGGFAKVLASLKGEHDRFLWWVAAQRAERLKVAGLENLFGDTDIAALKTLYQGNFKDGTPRAQVYIKALAKLNEFNDAILELSEKSGLIDAETRKLFKDAPYVPFFREKDGEMSVPRGGTGLANQYAFKKLKGGREKLHHDLLANVLLNWAHLYSAAAKNRAAVASMSAAVQAKVAEEVPAGTHGAVKVMQKGAPVYYLIEDPYVMEAITALNYVTPDFLKPLSMFKRWLTVGVTVNPTFKVRNLMRDSIAAVAQADLNPMIAPNLAQGWKGTRKNSQTFASMLAGGGVIRFGSLVEDNRAQRARQLVKQAGGELLDEAGWKKLAGQVAVVWDAYQELGDRLENVNRAALYERLIQKGHTHAEANFMARDLMDFTMSGKMPLVRFLAQSVPFLNARMQGLYKLGRAAQTNPYRFWATAGAVAMASLGLMLAFQDDDEWKKREDWDRDTYWWFRIGDKAYRIPKPFEVGAFGTLAERTWELMFNKEMTGRRYRDRISAMLFQTFAFDPTPQIVKPILDVYANRDGFTGRSIEGPSMERLRTEDRYDERTTSTAKFLGQLGLPDPVHLAKGDVKGLSPKQIDFMIRGYFGWLGATLVSGVDFGLRPFQNRGVQPSRTLKDTFFVGNFVEALPAGSSRYVTQMYEQANEVEKVYHSYRDALQHGDTEKARLIRKAEGEKLARYEGIQDAKKEVGDINRRIREVESHKTMAAEAKRAEIDRLNAARNRVAQIATKQTPGRLRW